MRCIEVFDRSCQVLPGGVNSPVRAFKQVGGTPLVVASGLGAKIRDLDEREWIDYCGSWGTAILGHAHPSVVSAAVRQMELGSSFGITTELEEQMASTVVRLVPSVEKIRFVSSGTEATMTAVRIARGYTRRRKIVTFSGCYHGHSDALLVQAGSGALDLQVAGLTPGAVADTISLPFNEPSAVRALFAEQGHEIAALIVEPIPANMGVIPPRKGFLELLREETQRSGALLIFDEVITGFRVALGGAQELFGVRPDLTCLGKVIGGGFPAAAVGGKRDVMDVLAPLGPVYQAGTLSGHPVAMSAGLATLQWMQAPGFYQNLEAKARRLTDPIQQTIDALGLNACVQRVGSLFTLFFGVKELSNHQMTKQLDMKRFALFFHYLLNRGIYVPPSQHEAWFVSSVHTDEMLDYTARTIIQYLGVDS
jgi:glutamate-1-semialdehyde 2,1-aminomutase